LGLGNLEFRVSNYGAACLALLFIYVMWALLSAMLSDYPSESVKRVLTILLSSLFFSLICQSMKPSDIFEGGKRVLLLFVIFISALVLISVILSFIGSLYYDPEIGFVQELSLLGFKVGQEVSGDHFLPRYFSL